MPATNSMKDTPMTRTMFILFGFILASPALAGDAPSPTDPAVWRALLAEEEAARDLEASSDEARYLPGARTGDREAIRELIFGYEYAGRYDDVLAWLRIGADRGDLELAHHAGLRLCLGRGAAPEAALCRRYLKQAATRFDGPGFEPHRYPIADGYELTYHFGKKFDDPHHAILSREGVPVYATKWFTHGDASDLTAPLREDVTGDGRPELIFEYQTGAWERCCTHLTVFAFDPDLTVIADFDTQDVRLRDVDGRPGKEIVIYDRFLIYWPTEDGLSGGDIIEAYREDELERTESYSPLVYAYREGRYRFAADLTKTAEHDDQLVPPGRKMDIGARAARFRADWQNPEIRQEFTHLFVALIFRGRGEQALMLIEESWPKGEPGLDSFMNGLARELVTDPNWLEIRALNGW